MTLPVRTIRFALSKALAENQSWAVVAFPEIIRRATGYSERWAPAGNWLDPDEGTSVWEYRVHGSPEIDPVVDHLIHELTDAVLLSEWHSVSEDRFMLGNMHRDRPARTTEESASGQDIESETDTRRDPVRSSDD